MQDELYTFTPTSSASGATFSAINLPSWAQIDPYSGTLSGFPDNPGQYAGIQIVATLGSATTSLAPFTITVAGDPLISQMWNLQNTGQAAFSPSSGIAGFDARIRAAHRLSFNGQTVRGRGVRVDISDTGTQITHEDLAANILYVNGTIASRNYNNAPPYNGDPGVVDAIESGVHTGDHGTGVAPLAQLATFNFLNSSQSNAVEIDQVTDPLASVMNQSWGVAFPSWRAGAQANAIGYSAIDPNYLDAIKATVTQNRNGLGLVIARAAGNNFSFQEGSIYRSVNCNADGNNTHPYTVNVAAFNANGDPADYTSPGSCIWISGPGGEFSQITPAIISTDLMTCNAGASQTVTTQNAFQSGGAPNTGCNYTDAFNGTSAATPHVSGTVALMLEINPNLSWRDVKHILASTAQRFYPNADPIAYTFDPTSPFQHISIPGWTQNAAGFYYHNLYGFGSLDAAAAVKMAQSYTSALGTWQETLNNSGNWSFDTGAQDLALAIPDNNSTGVTSTITVTANLIIEAVQISVVATHPNAGQLGVELVSPSGTRSVVLQTNNAYNTANLGTPSYLTSDPSSPITEVGDVMLTNAFYFESTLGTSSTGTWTLNVIDGASGQTGTLNRWAIDFYGHAP
jgi:subtilisin-like proprotein convertase family protein